MPSARMCSTTSPIHSTCCSIDTGMFESTEGEPGPVIMNRFGKPTLDTPRYVSGPCSHLSLSLRPSLPWMSILKNGPVMASKPVANTMMSSS